MKTAQKIGLYGGTFSPPHIGHIHAAKAFLASGWIGELIIMPTFLPPHKAQTDGATPEDRLAMCRLAFSFSPRIRVSDMEIRREGKSYTSDTLLTLKEEGKDIVFLCGTDMFLTMDSWHEPQTVFANAEIACIRRESDPHGMDALSEKAALYREKFGAKIRFLEADALILSSSKVRQRILAGKDWRALLSPEVASYIEEKELYR